MLRATWRTKNHGGDYIQDLSQTMDACAWTHSTIKCLQTIWNARRGRFKTQFNLAYSILLALHSISSSEAKWYASCLSLSFFFFLIIHSYLVCCCEADSTLTGYVRSSTLLSGLLSRDKPWPRGTSCEEWWTPVDQSDKQRKEKIYFNKHPHQNQHYKLTVVMLLKPHDARKSFHLGGMWRHLRALELIFLSSADWAKGQTRACK